MLRVLPFTLVAVTTIQFIGGGTLSRARAAFLVAQDVIPQEQPVMATLPVEICLNLPDWQRPSQQLQEKQLQSMPRYGAALQDEPLLSVAKAWWGHEVFSFTTYGLSARTDPLYLSGLWTAMEETWDCYSSSQPDQINNGQMAEVWLMHHRLLALEWQDNQYVMTVEPSESGLQLVQFPRREQGQALPLSLITVAGDVLPVMVGDW
ncbi:hypothetical protein HC928_04035 [bacterium]|nr:hypothetical protein [bacterium]